MCYKSYFDIFNYGKKNYTYTYFLILLLYAKKKNKHIYNFLLIMF